MIWSVETTRRLNNKQFNNYADALSYFKSIKRLRIIRMRQIYITCIKCNISLYEGIRHKDPDGIVYEKYYNTINRYSYLQYCRNCVKSVCNHKYELQRWLGGNLKCYDVYICKVCNYHKYILNLDQLPLEIKKYTLLIRELLASKSITTYKEDDEI